MKRIFFGDIRFSSHWRKPLWVVTAVFGISAALLIGACLWILYTPARVDINFATAAPSQKYFSILDGMPTDAEAGQISATIAVMIDNFPTVRTRQFGLTQAAVVYEVPVEGGLTRYLAIFDRAKNVVQVGPVRSARPYFLDWLADYGAPIYMHSGGSPDALTEIKNREMVDANEFYFGQYYWRDYDIAAPHNLFTSSERWQKLADKIMSSSSVWSGRQFGDLGQAQLVPVRSITIKYSQNYAPKWQFNAETGAYNRLVNGQIYIDAVGSGLTADNVVIQYVNMRSLDEEDRKEITTVGDGSARLLRDGKMVYAIWKKADTNSRTIFYDLNGEEIKFKPGATWIQIVPRDVVVEVGN